MPLDAAAIPARRMLSMPLMHGRSRVKLLARQASPVFMQESSSSFLDWTDKDFSCIDLLRRASFSIILAAVLPPFLISLRLLNSSWIASTTGTPSNILRCIRACTAAEEFPIPATSLSDVLVPLRRLLPIRRFLSRSFLLVSSKSFELPSELEPKPESIAAELSAFVIAAISFTPSPHINTCFFCFSQFTNVYLSFGEALATTLT
mmetsp:Transcript_21599/g.35621  ORF Transcript_21599/g.35621 Transcript_21599/m.35621 type:complete len:205 (-) Transcript_21599:196-810(-)